MRTWSAVLLAALVTGCVSSTPGVVRTNEDNPLVTIGAGSALISASGDAWRVWYVVDRATQTCWIKLGDSGAAMNCCDLRKVEAARGYITWETDRSCAAIDGGVNDTSETPPSPPPAAPTPPTP